MRKTSGFRWTTSAVIDMKICKDCGQELPLSHFNKDATREDGHQRICKTCMAVYKKEYRQKAKEKVYAYNRMYHEKYPERRKEWVRIGNKNQAAAKSMYNHKRRALSKNVVFSELDELIYEEAQDLAQKRGQLTNFQWHVDHIVPLFHKNACGLNNGFNLQVVPAKWNLQKNNKNMAVYWPNTLSGY